MINWTSCPRSVFPMLLLVGGILTSGTVLHAGIITTNVQMQAVQQVSFFSPVGPVIGTLVAVGVVQFNFEVDDNNNTTGSGSFVDALFKGFISNDFAALGLAGAPFELFTLPSDQTLTVSDNGTFVSLETMFGLRVFGPSGGVVANFYTISLSTFESQVNSLSDFTGAVFQDPDRPDDQTDIYTEVNGTGARVGYSFDRTVSTVPEPSSVALWSGGILLLSLFARRRQFQTAM